MCTDAVSPSIPSPPSALTSARGWSWRTAFARETSGGRVIPQVDGLRFIAIASVVLFHICGVLTETTSRTHAPFRNPHAVTAFGPASHETLLYQVLIQGGFGVRLFFTISGFVLGLPMARRHLLGEGGVPLRRYFIRRVTRIEPPYMICILILTLLWIVPLHRPATEILPHFVASVFYLHNFVLPDLPGLSSVLWSLEIEVQFYILAPLLATVFLVRPAALRRGILALAIVCLGASQPFLQSAIPYNSLPWHLHYFLVGFLLVDFHALSWNSEPRRPLCWDAISTLAWAAIPAILMATPVPDRSAVAQVLLGLAVFVAYLAAFRGRVWKWLLSIPAVYITGGMCYTIYLYHALVVLGLKPITTRFALTDLFWVNLLIQAALMSVAVLGASGVLFVLFEKPFMRRDWPAQVKNTLNRLLARSGVL